MKKPVVTEITKKKIPMPFPSLTRVCAYVRVSTPCEEQLDSLRNQTEYYHRRFSNSPLYSFVGVFSDAGISGGNVNRPGFQEMLSCARSGEIDLIFTKSISRFARNTLVLLEAVRELKDIGVGVIFEEQNINTLSSEGEMMLTIIGAFAEEELRSTAQNNKLSWRNRFKRGNVKISANQLVGYRNNDKGQLEIDEHQAWIIREVYERYLCGKSINDIVREFREDGIPSFSKNIWGKDKIKRILSNEKYCGDLLMQKSFINENGKEVKNKGQLPKYFVKDHHPAIISREDWEKVQEMRKARSNRYPFSKLLKCPHCGSSLYHTTNNRGLVYWSCGRFRDYTKSACIGINVPEKKIMELHKVKPITEPMVIMEVKSQDGSKGKSKKNYSLIPVNEYRKEE
ncbi:recombinase family protein [Acidaminobacter hydrogenoformans]|uniref:Site-specific DNA recombinase n=1 Tax=Acidaminobacter hydrogenoformans DSM 2784 TaxID=1120920 RepID=A0A1G5S0N0_9FIRM|nr:recombinase family protein [Acidaminobacter hydrogenoformans]SCZ79500.1 Site-specific DNA recombinase [Acidaminobacter hydrogenoformans DSM 2784]